MSGLNTGVCGHSGCENPVPRDEDFCCAGCEEATVREDEATALEAWFGGYGAAPQNAPAPVTTPSLRERIEALPKVFARSSAGVRLALPDGWEGTPLVRVRDVLALLDPECSLCEQGHVPAQPCGDLGPRPSVQQSDVEYPITLFNDRAGVWVEWENDWHGRIVGPPDDAVDRRVEPGF